MAVVASVMEIFSTLQTVYETYQDLQDRFEKACQNPKLAKDLGKVFSRLLSQISPLAETCTNNDVKFSKHYLSIFESRIQKLADFIDDTNTQLEEKKKKLRSRLYRFRTAKTTSEWLSQLNAGAGKAEDDVLAVASCFANALLITKANTGIENLTAEVVDLKENVSAMAVSNEKRDSFGPSFDIPTNPPHVVMDFGCVSDMEREDVGHLTVESQLKHAVLRRPGSQNVAAVSSRPVHSVGMDGMSGVGKSCALRGLATDRQVRQRFPGGIYFVVLGKDAKEADVVQQLAWMSEQSGGVEIGKAVVEEGNIDGAVRKARQWFSNKCILLLIDDVWEKSNVGRNILARLERIVDTDCDSRVAFTTREARVTRRSYAVHFSARDADTSRQMLLDAAGLKRDDVEHFGTLVDGVLGLCGGLPMALSVAGSAIALRHSLADESTLEETWMEYLSVLQKYPVRLLRDSDEGYAYENLESAFGASLSMLDESLAQKLGFECSKSFFEMYRSLVVLRRQGWIPVSVLCRLWGTSDEIEATEVLQMLAEANLAERKDRTLNGRKMSGVTLHDLQLDFANAACKKLGEMKKWHRELLCSWLPEEGSSSSQSMFPCRRWSQDDVSRDEYIRNNVSRHLMAAGLRRELHGLLRNPEWTAKRLCVNEILSLEDDFRIMLEHLGKEGSESQSGSDVWSLKMIAGAARLSAPYVSQNPTEVWFQLRTRLLDHAEESEVIKVFVSDIIECAERPWVKALTPCLPGPGGALQATILCNETVSWISALDGGERLYACGMSDGKAFVYTFVKGQLEEEVWQSMRADDVGASEVASKKEFHSSPLHEGASTKDSSIEEDSGSVSSSGVGSRYVSAVCCTKDGSRAVMGYGDGTVQVWNTKTGEALGEALCGHVGSVKCVAWSPDGTRIASASEDKTVRVWDAEKGEPVGDTLRGHTNSVQCVAWSPDGTRVASGSWDDTIRLWDAEKGEAVGEDLCGHNNRVNCVAWSPDGTRLASGAWDDTVRLWDVEKGEAVGDALRGHNATIKCITWSPDGTRVASGAWDDTVRVWDVKNGKAVGEALRGHSNGVTCVAWSPDGTRLASGAWDKTVRLWDTEKGEAVDEVLRSQNDMVECIAWSPDGIRVASGVRNGAVRLWDVKEGEAVGEDLLGHSGWVMCVAWSPDGTLVASGARDRTIRLWDIKKGEAVGEALHGHTATVKCIAWSPDGTRLASGALDDTVRVWDVMNGKAVGEALRGHKGTVECIAWSPDGTRLASGAWDDTVRVWDVKMGKAVGEALRGHSEEVTCVAWSPDGMRLASGSQDGTTRLWDVETRKCLRSEDDGSTRLRLGEEQEPYMRVDGGSTSRISTSVVYCSTDKEMVLATLEDGAHGDLATLEEGHWDFSEVNRRVVVGRRNGEVAFLELVE